MVIPPYDYTMKKKFIKRLLIEMVKCLLNSRQLSAEHTLFNILLEEAKALDNSM
jgi:hypothetical protein